MNSATLVSLFFVLLLASCASAPAPEMVAPLVAQTSEQKHDEQSPGFRLPLDTRPLDYALHFDIDPAQESFTGTANITVQLDTARTSIWLHARGLSVSQATVNGALARFTQVDDDGMARLAIDTPVGPGAVDVKLAWSAKYNASLESVYRVRFDSAWYVFTQFEAIMAREAFPCFDEPGFKAPFTLSFTTKQGDVVVANTSVVASVADGAGTRTTFDKTQPLPTYLLAFAVGPLDIVQGQALPPTAERQQPVAIRGITAKGKGKDLGVSLDVTLRALASLERYFGIPYPYGKLDIVAVPDFAAGAMENAGLVTFRDSLLFVNAASSIAVQRSNAHVIAHELAHQWFGNFVTLAWWDDIWLNEAFASWAQTRVIEEIRPDLNATVDARGAADWVTGEDSLVSVRQVRQPVLSKGDIITAFDGITYTKGASVIAMFESYAGKDAFQQGVREYLRARAHGTATAADLLAALSKTSGKDISTPFSTFLDQPGVPFVQAKLVCDAKGAQLELSQSRYLPVGSTGDRDKTWQLPVCARAGTATSCALLSERTGALALGAQCPKVLMPNADGLGYFRWSLPGDQLKALSSSLKALTPGERISFGNAVRASAWAGSLSFADALAASNPLARDLEPAVADTPLSLYTFAWSELVEVQARPKVMKALADLYRPVLHEVKLRPQANEDPRVRDRRTLAVSALLLADDPQVSAQLVKLGRAALAGGKVNLAAVPADLAGQAIAAAIKAGGAQGFSEAAAMLSTESDSITRQYLLAGLGGVDDLPRGQLALALALDARLKVNEIMIPLRGQLSDPRTREQAWAFSRTHVDALLTRLPESAGGEILPHIAGGGCDEGAAVDLAAFLQQYQALPGLERTLAQALEEIRLCAARAALHRASARQLFRE